MKETISEYEAGMMLLAVAESRDFKDRLYEFAQDLCDKRIREIEAKYDIECSGLDSDAAWYDDVKQDAMKAIFEKLYDLENV